MCFGQSIFFLLFLESSSLELDEEEDELELLLEDEDELLLLLLLFLFLFLLLLPFYFSCPPLSSLLSAWCASLFSGMRAVTFL